MASDDCGFLIVASRDRVFLEQAIQCAESIKDEWSEARVCIATHEDWLDDSVRRLYDVVSPVPDHVRAKLWALPRSPYRRTQYVDADAYCVHRDVRTIFEIEPDAPLLMTENRAYNSAVVYFTPDAVVHHRDGPAMHERGECERLRWHCGFFRYDLPATESLVRDWLDMLARNHRDGPGPAGGPHVRWWDTYAFWRCLREKAYGFEPRRYPFPDARWQFVEGYRREELDGQEPIFRHYTIPGRYRNRRGDGDMGKLR